MVIRFLSVLLVVTLPLVPGTVRAAEAKVRIVFFTPKDVEPPANVPQRMQEIVEYGRTFYGKWMQRWGYEPGNLLPVDQNKDGTPVVYFVKGAETVASGAYDKIGIQGPIREQAIAQYKIPRAGSTWWIFVYGTKLGVSRGYGGYADKKGNGYTLLVWNDVPGKLTPDVPLAGGVADKLNLKGYLHEFGHTMSLPHIGPMNRHRSGMSLMGPNARTYRRARSRTEQKVYLTPAVAALIWKQPQMTGQFEARPRLPKIEVTDFKPVYEAKAKRFVLSGKLKSDLKAHSVVAIDIPEKGPGEYWKKGYSNRLEPNGEFELVVDELLPSSGVVKVVFCFENGVFSGTGKGIGFRHAAEIPYKFVRNRYTIGN